MLIQKETNQNKISIKGYSPGEITLQTETYSSPIMLTANSVTRFEAVDSFESLEAKHIESLADKDTEMVIIGSGEKHQLITLAKIKSLNDKGIAVESMSTRNACHTFQVLVHENRKVTALLFP